MQRFSKLLWLVFILVAGGVAAPLSAGDKKKEEGLEIPPVKRGPEHKVLESLTGTFDAKVKLFATPGKPPVESAGVLTRKMILDGNFLQEKFEGAFFGKPFSGLGLIGYDSFKKKYVTTWCDNMSTSVAIMHGSYDTASKTFTSIGEDIDPGNGKKMKARDVLKIVSPNAQFFEMHRQPEGVPNEFKIMEITYTRRNPEKK